MESRPSSPWIGNEQDQSDIFDTITQEPFNDSGEDGVASECEDERCAEANLQVYEQNVQIYTEEVKANETTVSNATTRVAKQEANAKLRHSKEILENNQNSLARATAEILAIKKRRNAKATATSPGWT